MRGRTQYQTTEYQPRPGTITQTRFFFRHTKVTLSCTTRSLRGHHVPQSLLETGAIFATASFFLFAHKPKTSVCLDPTLISCMQINAGYFAVGEVDGGKMGVGENILSGRCLHCHFRDGNTQSTNFHSQKPPITAPFMDPSNHPPKPTSVTSTRCRLHPGMCLESGVLAMQTAPSLFTTRPDRSRHARYPPCPSGRLENG